MEVARAYQLRPVMLLLASVFDGARGHLSRLNGRVKRRCFRPRLATFFEDALGNCDSIVLRTSFSSSCSGCGYWANQVLLPHVW